MMRFDQFQMNACHVKYGLLITWCQVTCDIVNAVSCGTEWMVNSAMTHFLRLHSQLAILSAVKNRPEHMTSHLSGSPRPLYHPTNNSLVLLPFRHSLIWDVDTCLPPGTSSIHSLALQYMHKTCGAQVRLLVAQKTVMILVVTCFFLCFR